MQAMVMGRAGAAPGAAGAVGHLDAASLPSSTSLQPHPGLSELLSSPGPAQSCCNFHSGLPRASIARET